MAWVFRGLGPRGVRLGRVVSCSVMGTEAQEITDSDWLDSFRIASLPWVISDAQFPNSKRRSKLQ